MTAKRIPVLTSHGRRGACVRRIVILGLMLAALAVAVPASASAHSTSADAADPKGFVCTKLDADRVICDPLTYRVSLEEPVGKPIKEIRRGQRFEVVLWSPNLPEGRKVRFGLCVNKTKGEQCSSYKEWIIKGGRYTSIVRWRVDPNEGRNGVLTITLKVDGRRVASKSLGLRE